MLERLSIFLSSTQSDLAEPRKNILRYLGVLKTDLIAMEVFGSDETKPLDFALSQVRRCNIFVGIYAERYGSLDPRSGQSITELEYLEAKTMFERGKLDALLLYVIDPRTSWPLDLVERDPEKMAKLENLKATIQSNHTVSFFQNVDDLPFLILRDVIRKLEIGSGAFFRAKQQRIVKHRASLRRPMGMEYYGEDLAGVFFGRDNELNGLLNQILMHKMSLLIGASGIGKTSLLSAGVVNHIREMGWRAALVRPLTEPINTLKRHLWDQLLEGQPPAEFDLSSVINAALTADKDAPLLIVLDQFEDVLKTRDSSDIQKLTANLLAIYNSGDENLRILVSYRGDVEPQIGAIWQRISGSPAGLPRTYLGTLDIQNAGIVLNSTLAALGIAVQARGKRPPLVEAILADLEIESSLSGYDGIYPPFLQMILARIHEDKDHGGNYSSEKYYSSGRCKRIIADFLVNQLKYLGKKIEVGKAILIALVSTFGTKAQKTLKEIIEESLMAKAEVEDVLASLVDLRLVRVVNGVYEISHDFLAKIIMTELVSLEERQAKKFKDPWHHESQLMSLPKWD